jgi:hypothetical protein
MNRTTGKVMIIWALASGLIVSAFAMSLQVDLWLERGSDWNGAFAAVDYDEPFYASYLQSLIDGKPRRNSPYTGVEDSAASPQKESYLSIQFLASEPPALIARLFGLSSSTTMMILAPVIGFLSAIALFSLICSLIESPSTSFAITLVVLLCGGIIAGQGGVMSFVSPDTVHYSSSFLFLRRSVPAMSFPALLLFFVFVWRLFVAQTSRSKWVAAALSILSFAFMVYGYFYHWTIALGWFSVLVILWAAFRFDDLKANKLYLVGVIFGFLVVLAPYVILLLNRSAETDSALMFNLTHQPDLFRMPSIVGYAAILMISVCVPTGILNIRRPVVLVLLSFALLPMVVFNQQVLTGRSLQPFHYQLFGANYIALLALLAVIFLLIKEHCDFSILKVTAGLVSALALFLGFFDASYAAGDLRGLNKWRDELFPVGQRIREIEASEKPERNGTKPVVLSFDFMHPFPINSAELPAISSQAVVWDSHLPMFPDTNSKASALRLNTYLYFQNLDKNWVDGELRGGNNLLALGYFGGIRSNDPSINESARPTADEITDVVNQYGEFADDFNYDMPASLPISYVIVQTDAQKEDLSAIDKWYERDAGEAVGKYTIYRVRLRPRVQL